MIGRLVRRGCGAHQAALLDFAARRAGGADVRRALDHVGRCRACEDDLAATTLVLHALRRLNAETEQAAPAPDGWARLRERLAAGRRRPSLLLSGLPGIVTAFGICAALVGPAAVAGGRPPGVYNEAPRSAPPPYLLFEESRERATAAGLLPEPEVPLPYRGIRITPPPISADLPPSMGWQIETVEEVDDSVALATASATTESPVAERQAGRR